MKVWYWIKSKIRKKILNAVLFDLKKQGAKSDEGRKVYDGFKEIKSNSFFWGEQHFISGRENMEIGENVHIGNNAFIRAEGGVTIGDNTHISRNLVLYSINHDYEGGQLPYDAKMIGKKVSIGRNVWIGMNVCITPGTTIGDGCVVGMGTTVSGIIPPLSIVTSPKCIVVKGRDKEHYEYLDKMKRYGGPNGVLYNWGGNSLLKEIGDVYLARRSNSTLVEVNGSRAVKKEFLKTKDGIKAFTTERDALHGLQHFNWCPKVIETGDNYIITEFYDNSQRIDQRATFPKELLGEILWNLFELFEAGYVHRDFHARNIFETKDGLKFIDFETAQKINIAEDFWDSYDITGEGQESPFFTEKMGVMNRYAEHSLSKLFGINSIADLKELFEKELEKRMYDSSINFRTLRDGKERHFLRYPKIYASFDLKYTKIPNQISQRDTFKRFDRFNINRADIDGKSILDIGSNIGATLLNLQRYNPLLMLGLEYDESKVIISRKIARYNLIENIRFKQFDIEADEYEEGTFDVVFCLAVVEHLKNKEKLFEILGRATKNTLFFEGNANSNIEYLTNSLKKAGFREINYLGFSDDEENQSNNCRPLFIAKK